MTRPPRGSAVVELALGTTLFVTILLFGIYFAEVGFIGQKVIEANNFAVFDATGRKMHDAENNRWALVSRTAAADARDAAEDRYRDLSGTHKRAGRARTHQQAMARVRPVSNALINVECSFGRAVGIDVFNVASVGAELSAGISANEDTAMACQAYASVDTVRIPRNFLEGGRKGKGGLFKSQMSDGLAIPLCAVGDAVRGSCTRPGAGRLAVLLDDWGFSGYADGRTCHLLKPDDNGTCANSAYYKTVERVYQESKAAKSGEGYKLVRAMGGRSMDIKSGKMEGKFYMSFQDEDSKFGKFTEENPGGSMEGSPNDRWYTTPFRNGDNRSYEDSYNQRKDNGSCFLGLDCPRGR